MRALLGRWDVVIHLPDGEKAASEITFEELGEFIVQRSTVERPEFPDSVSIIGDDAMHYFDTRGVARVFTSTVDDRVWTLSRGPQHRSDFWQRFIGELSADGNALEGRWEKCDDGTSWELDFPVTWSKRG